VHRLVVSVEHVVVEHAVRLGVHSGGHGEMVDERLRRERAAHVRRRGGSVPEPGHCRRQVGPDVTGPETVERHDHRHRVSADDRHSGRRHREDRGDPTALHGRRSAHTADGGRRRAEQRTKEGTSDHLRF